MSKDGMHYFRIIVTSNDPTEPRKELYLRADFGPKE